MKNKKIFPKIKKKLKSFLADESGKITKKDALGVAAWAMLLSGVEEVSGHSSQSFLNWYYRTSTHSYTPSTHSYTPSTYTRESISCVWYSSHASGIVNWHYSWTPSAGCYTTGRWSSYTPSSDSYRASSDYYRGSSDYYRGSSDSHRVAHSSHSSWGWC